MTAGKNRARLVLEPLEGRCTPGGGVGSSLSAQLPASLGGPYAKTAPYVRAAQASVVPFQMAFRCSIDLNSLTVSSTGNSTSFGNGGRVDWTWTSLGHADTVDINRARDRGTYSGTGTLVTSTGDRLFYAFTTSWRLSTGKGTHLLTALGGTGQFAGASGHAFGICTITADPESPNIYHCRSQGNGVLTLPSP